jgi:hypothetical protein
VRFARLATPIAMLCLALAGCGGGSNVTVQEVPGGAVDLKVPGGAALAPTATATATADASATATPASTTAPATGNTPAQSPTQQSAAPPQSTPAAGTPGGGAAAPNANPTPPPGADKQQFEAFCQQNPGAC